MYIHNINKKYIHTHTIHVYIYNITQRSCGPEGSDVFRRTVDLGGGYTERIFFSPYFPDR